MSPCLLQLVDRLAEWSQPVPQDQERGHLRCLEHLEHLEHLEEELLALGFQLVVLEEEPDPFLVSLGSQGLV